MSDHRRRDPRRAALFATAGLLLSIVAVTGATAPAAAAEDPVVTVTTPADDAVYGPSQLVVADYVCTYQGVPFSEGCGGTVPVGSPIDTSTSGDHEFTVTASAHGSNTVTHTYLVTEKPLSYRATIQSLGDEVLDGPRAVDRDSDGNLYIADTDNDRIVVKSSSGEDPQFWGGSGTGPGQFDQPMGIAVGPDGKVYVADTGNHRIQVLSPTGEYLDQWGEPTDPVVQLDKPEGVDVDPVHGDVYVADAGADSVHRYAPSGLHLGSVGGRGTGDRQFNAPRDVAVASDQRIYVTDGSNNRIQVLDSMGTYLGQWGHDGTGPGEMTNPWGIDVGPDGAVYVSDSGNDRVQKFLPDGRYLTQWGGTGHDHGRFFMPTGLLVVPDNGSVYVADRSNWRIERYSPQSRPDARIRKGAGADRGNDVYGTDGTGQTARMQVAPGVAATYTITGRERRSDPRCPRRPGAGRDHPLRRPLPGPACSRSATRWTATAARRRSSPAPTGRRSSTPRRSRWCASTSGSVHGPGRATR